MIFRCHSELNEEIRLTFYPCKNLGENMTWEECHSAKPLIIFREDYTKLLLHYLTEIHPTTDPTNNQIIQQFDECFDNWIGKNDWLKIIARINQDIQQTDNRLTKLEKEFYENMIEWLENNLEWADLIMVEGNQ